MTKRRNLTCRVEIKSTVEETIFAVTSGSLLSHDSIEWLMDYAGFYTEGHDYEVINQKRHKDGVFHMDILLRKIKT